MEELIVLMRDVAEIDSEIDALTNVRNALRQRLETLVSDLGGKIEVPGVGSAYIQATTKSHSFDTKGIDELIQQLIADGELHTAKRLIAFRKESIRTGGLRIRMEKQA